MQVNNADSTRVYVMDSTTAVVGEAETCIPVVSSLEGSNRTEEPAESKLLWPNLRD